MPLTPDQIKLALTALGQDAEARGTHIRLLIVGGAAMALCFGNRDSTKDVDAVFLEPADPTLVRRLALGVARRLDLPDDWLNDAVKGYLRPPVHETAVFEAPGLVATVPALEQMAALKLSAWRDDIDISDAETILRAIKQAGATREQAWSAIGPYLAPGMELKAKYAYNELWSQL